ncbi:hypothetical protein V1509DRAFT_632799 [Lipomyces kononenkoae]
MPITLDLPSLRNELEILHLIVHRNRNQHRQAKWWKYVNIIHRNLKNLVYIPQQESRQKQQKSLSKLGEKRVRVSRDEKRRRKIERQKGNKESLFESIGNDDPARPRRLEHSAIVFNRTPESETTGLIGLDLSPWDLMPVPFNHVERAEYLVYRVIPKAFNAFQRVIAHGQYVTLGLVLLATVSRIWCILRQDTKVFRPNQRKVSAIDSITQARDNDDLGQIIKRHAGDTVDLTAEVENFGDNEEDINMVQGSDVADISEDSGLHIYDEDEIEDETPADQSSTSSLRIEPVKRRKIEVDDDMDGLKFFS